MRKIEDLIPEGHANAITRGELVSLTGLPDESVRKMIRESEAFIINLGDGKGYFKPLATEMDLYMVWRAQFLSRIREEASRLRKGEEWAEALMFECDLFGCNDGREEEV